MPCNHNAVLEQPLDAILAIRHGSLGDLVLCSALVDKVSKEAPQVPFYFQTKAEFSSLVSERFPHDKIQHLEAPSGLWANFRSGLGLVGKLGLHKGNHLLLCDLQGNLKSLAFLWGALISCKLKKVRLIFRKTRRDSMARSLSVLFHHDFLAGQAVFAKHLHILGGSENYHPNLRSVERNPRTRKRILIAPGAKHWKKRWLVTHWERLLELMQKSPEAHYEITLVGARNDFPADLQDEIESNWGERVENLLGKTDLSLLADIARDHDLCICGNSAWLHLCEAVGVPVLSISGPIVRGFGFSPWSPESRELYVDLDCRPCSKHGGGRCIKSGDDFHACMRRIEAEEVLGNLEEMLRSPRA